VLYWIIRHWQSDCDLAYLNELKTALLWWLN
jgi:hypothetical protein